MNTIKVKLDGELLNIDQRFSLVSGLLSELVQQSDQDEIFDLSSEYVGLEQFKIIQQYYTQNNFDPSDIQVTTDDPKQVFKQQDLDLIMKYNPLDGKDLLKLIQAAIYLNLSHFKKLCLARIAIEYFIDKNNPQPYIEKLQKKYPQVPQITLQDVQAYRQQFPFLFDQYF